MNGEVRLIDFGCSERLHEAPFEKVLNKQAARFSSPEVYDDKAAGLPSDWWSYGVIITLLYQLKHPFNGKDDEETQKMARTCKPHLDMSMLTSNAAKLISKLLVVEPKNRISKVSTHELFENVPVARFIPEPPKIPTHEASKKDQYYSNDPEIYELLESHLIRIPSSEFLSSDILKSEC